MDASASERGPRRRGRGRIGLGRGGGGISVVKLSGGDNGSKMEEISRVLGGEEPGRRLDNSGSKGTQPHCWQLNLNSDEGRIDLPKKTRFI